jgi:UPF0716 protein FxsA
LPTANVLYRLLLLLVVLPLVEMTLLLLIGQYTHSVLVPILFIIVTGVAGSWLARQQGFSVYRRIQSELAAGRMPTEAMLDGMMIFVAGLLMVTPGVLTDVLGLSMLIPPVRAFYRRRLLAWLRRNFQVQTPFAPASPGGRADQVIDSYVVEKQSPDDVSDQV